MRFVCLSVCLCLVAQAQKTGSPATPRRIRVGSLVQEARVAHRVEPRYEAFGPNVRIKGVVLLSAVIAKDGSVSELKTLQGHPMLIPGALLAVKQWRYRETLLNGKPVEVVTTIEVGFGAPTWAQVYKKLSFELRRLTESGWDGAARVSQVSIRAKLGDLTPEGRTTLTGAGLDVSLAGDAATGTLDLISLREVAILDDVERVFLLNEPPHDPAKGFVGSSPGAGPFGEIISATPNVTPPPHPPVRAQPLRPKRIRVSGPVQRHRLLYRVEPDYPALARQGGLSGTVHLRATIGNDGLVHSVHVLDGHPLLASAAVAAVKQWRYTPTLLNGRPVEVVVNIDVPFGEGARQPVHDLPAMMSNKLSPALQQAFWQVRGNSPEFRSMHVRVSLNQLTSAVTDLLHREGLTIEDGHLVATGRIAREAAERAVSMEEVKQIFLASE